MNPASPPGKNPVSGKPGSGFDPALIQKALDASGTGVWQINLLTNQAVFSSLAIRLFGLDEQRLSEWHDQLKARIHPQDRERVFHEMVTTRSRRGGKILTTYRILSGDGTYRWLSMRGRITTVSPDGKPEQFMGLVSDITNQTILEERLRESEERYHHMVESAPDLIFIIGRDGKYRFVNRSMIALLKKPSEEIIGKSFGEVWDAAQGSFDFSTVEGASQDALETVFRQGTVLNTTGRIVQEGQIRWYNTTLSPVRDENGAIEAVLGIARDITPIKRAKENIRRLVTQMAFLNDLFTTAITTTSFDDFLARVAGHLHEIIPFDAMMVYRLLPDNATAELMYHEGIRDDTATALRVINSRFENYLPVYRDGVPQYIANPEESSALGSGYGFLYLVRIPLYGDAGIIGSLHIAGRTPHTFTPEERSFLDVIGKQAGLAITKVQFRKELVEAHRHANLYLDILTHDINNAITGPYLVSQMLHEDLEGHNKEISANILSGLDKCADIIRNVETIRRIHQARKSLHGIALDPMIQAEIQGNPGVVFKYNGTAAVANADELLREIFTNIIGNSIKYGGPDVVINIDVTEKGDMIEIRISDNGPGVPDEKKSLLFHRFARATDQKSGKGLGLYIISSLVRRYGGKIQAEDRIAGYPDLGLAVRFTIRKYRPPVG